MDKSVMILKNAELVYMPNFYDFTSAQLIFDKLLNEVNWKLDEIKIFGKVYLQPRLTAFYADEGINYTYSNLKLNTNSWTTFILDIKFKVELISNTKYNSVLLNYYRDGNDSNGWHADNETSLGKNPVIASVSFGQERTFQLKHNFIKNEKLNISLTNGSLLIMQGETQHYWKHQIPKTKSIIGPRINLTFRLIK